ncbi:MAG: hypothetical protein AB7F35_19750 [Acetobacteraceae bacterium]
MFDPEALRHKARLCFRLSRAATGDPIADALNKLGQEYERAAQLLEHRDFLVATDAVAAESRRCMELSIL